MPVLTEIPLRFACDVQSRTAAPPIGSSNEVIIYRGNPFVVQASVFNGTPAAGTFVDVSNVTLANLVIRENDEQGTVLIEKVLTDADVNTSLTYSNWIAGNGQQLAFVLSDTDTNQVVPSDGNLNIYGAISIVTPSGEITVGFFEGVIQEDGIGGATVPTAADYTSYSKEEVNALLLGSVFPLGISFSDISGTISLDQFPVGTISNLDSIDADALYFFDNTTFLPRLINAADTRTFLGISGGSGDVVGPSSSIDSEVVLFNSTTGKLVKRATGSGLAVLTSGVLSTTTNNSSNWDTAFTERHQWDGGATNLVAATGRTSLGLVIGTNVQAWDADLDTWATLTPSANFQTMVPHTFSQMRTDLGLVIGTNVQAWDSDLDTLAGLTATTNNFIVSVASAWASRTPAQVRTTLALTIGTDVQAWDADLDALAALSGTHTIYYRSAANTWSAVTIGTGLDFTAATLSATSSGADNLGLTPTAVKTANYTASAGDFVPVDTTSGNVTVTFPTAPADKSVIAIKHVIQGSTNVVNLALGGSDVFNKSGGSTTGSLALVNQAILVQYKATGAIWYVVSDDLSLGNLDSRYQPLDSDLTTIAGLTATTDNFIVSAASAWASRTPAQVRTTLGLVIGTNVQAWDADLDTIAGLTATTDNFIVSVASAWASRTPTQVKTTLGLVIGTNVQAWDADLDTWAAITRASGFDTFTTTPSSANLRALLTDKLGTGAALFDGPTLTLLLTTAACGSSLASINIPAGTVPTTPNDGDIFADANCLYACTDAGNPGVVPIRHIIRADTTVTQANDANPHAIFTTPTNGRLTLETGTYLVRGLLTWTAMSATSGNVKVDFLGAGTATTGSWAWLGFGADAASATTTYSGTGINTTSASGVAIVSVATATQCQIIVDGTFEVTVAGTMIPTQTLATAAAAVLSVGSFLYFERVGSTSMTSVGQWD